MRKGYAFGVMLVLGGGTCLSLGGILLRNLESADGWQVLFYRACTFFVTLFVILAARYRSNVFAAYRAVGWRGVLVGIVLGLGSIAYVFALLFTTVANAVFIIGASPLVTALVGWLWLRERLYASGVIAMFAAFAGIGLMLADGFVAGGWLGNAMALLVVLSFVVFLLLLRGGRDVDMLPATSLAGIVAALVAAVMAGSLYISPHDLVIALLLGTVQFCGGFMLITMSTRYVPAAEVALFSLSEAVLAPLWVWIGVDEVPSTLTLSGACVVFVAVVSYCLIGIRRERTA
jgi:drug/metabolite transporter (DMT)-like permease